VNSNVQSTTLIAIPLILLASEAERTSFWDKTNLVISELNEALAT